MTESKKLAVLGTWPDAKSSYHNCGMGGSYWTVDADGKEIGRAYCGAMSATNAWADAYSRLPVEAREPDKRERCPSMDSQEYQCVLVKGHDENHQVHQTDNGASIWSTEKAAGAEPLECGVKGHGTTSCTLRAGHDGFHWDESKEVSANMDAWPLPPATEPAQEESQQEWKNYTASHLSAQCPKLRAYLDLRDAELAASQREIERLKGEVASWKEGRQVAVDEVWHTAGERDLLQTAISKVVGILKAYAMDKHVERVVAILTKTQDSEDGSKG